MNHSCSAQAKTRVACPCLFYRLIIVKSLYNEKTKNPGGIPFFKGAHKFRHSAWVIFRSAIIIVVKAGKIL
jgi:hypothetical protein